MDVSLGPLAACRRGEAYSHQNQWACQLTMQPGLHSFGNYFLRALAGRLPPLPESGPVLGQLAERPRRLQAGRQVPQGDPARDMEPLAAEGYCWFRGATASERRGDTRVIRLPIAVNRGQSYNQRL